MTPSTQIAPLLATTTLERPWCRRPGYASRLLRFLRANDLGGGYGIDPKSHRIIVATLLTVATLLLCDPVLELLDNYDILPVSHLFRDSTRQYAN